MPNVTLQNTPYLNAARKRLSEQEVRMMDLLVQTGSLDEMAALMGLTNGSARVYLHKIYTKLDVRGMVEAVLVWVKKCPHCGRATH